MLKGLESILSEDKQSLLLYFLLGGLAKHLVAEWQARKMKKKVLVGKVSRILLHPVKSLGGIDIQEAEVTRIGLKDAGGIFDRHFAVVSGEEPVALTAKFTHVLATVKTEISKRTLKLSSPLHPHLGTVTLNCDEIEKTNKETEDITLHMMTVRGLDCGKEANDFLDGILGSPGHRLIYLPEDGIQRRPVRSLTKKYLSWQKIAKDNDQVGYQDCTQIMLMAQESLDDMNSQMDIKMDFDRFRPNVVASDTIPYDEDTWNEVFIGECKFTLLKLCSRCLMTCVDTETGEFHPDEEPLRTLRKYRMLVKGFGPVLGINLIVDTPGKIKVGDPIYAIRGPIKLHPPS